MKSPISGKLTTKCQATIPEKIRGIRRPALVLSDHIQFNKPGGHTVMAMITSQKNPDWPLDTTITGNHRAGLTAPSKVRMRLFTLDNRLIAKKIGTLNSKDKKAVSKALQSLLVTQL